LQDFAEKFSSFFGPLNLLRFGFSSSLRVSFPILVAFDFGTDEATPEPTQVPQLQGIFSSRFS